MVTIFTFLTDIITAKRGNLLNNIDDENQYISYMISRWISFYSPQFCKIINGTVNRYWPILQNKQDHYKFLSVVIPQSHFKRIAYIKKIKPEKEKDYDQVVSLLAQSLQTSKREVNMYVEELEMDLEPYMKALKVK
jgi:hypothetical protein